MKISDTLTNEKKELEFSDKVRIYLCGVTVYDQSHIGHARTIIVFDTLRRFLEANGIKVELIQNFTDVDDKIINRAKEQGESASGISSKYIQTYFEDSDRLNIKRATNYPKATEHIDDMINLIQDLVDKESAYVSKNGVYFRVSKFSEYGKLSKKKTEDLESGARIGVDEAKESPLDFALWKFSEGQPNWESPWGKGRPGWHIECSAMSTKYLGKNFEIHGGGRDLIFPHHENEIAQSCCANKTENFANYWLHNGFVTFDKEKMSKSLGNIVTINKLRENINGQVIRLALLSAHYKQPLDWNEKLIKDSQNTLDKWYNHFEEDDSDEINGDLLKPLLEDLNTPEYISKLHILYDECSKGNKSSKSKFLAGCKLIGLFREDKKSWENFKKSKAQLDEIFINKKIKDRNEARKKGNYKLADAIRKELEYNSVVIEDKKGKTIWKYK